MQKLFQLILFVSGLIPTAHAAPTTDIFVSLRGDHTYENYYAIDTHGSGRINLLDWLYVTDPQWMPPESYRRTVHFRGWITDPSRETCFDVRNLVLARQALDAFQTDANNKCRIYSSTWYDPYSDEYFHLAADLQIDHVVPLKNAYLAGAHAWSGERRCNYSNFLADHSHLIAVQKHANLSKGDRGPEDYLPINSQFQCQYVAEWLKIKAVWNLKIAIKEAEAIQQFLRETQCAQDGFDLAAEELAQLQVQAETPPEACNLLQEVETDTTSDGVR
jgi:hypothetical protein